MIKVNSSLNEFREIISYASIHMKPSDRRLFQADITLKYLEGSARKAESYFGWGRKPVAIGIKELETGIECIYDHSMQGNKTTEEKHPDLEKDIHSLVDCKSQTDPKFQSPFLYTNITAKKVREALIKHKGYKDNELPTERTISNILNRLGYKLTRVQKTKPKKKIEETDAIFDNVHQSNEDADKDEKILRISMDTKAKLDISESSRGGKSREKETPKGADHDMDVIEKITPFGILEVALGQLMVIMGTSKETSDFIVDALQIWWDERKEYYPLIEQLVINLDNGSSIESHRTQFIKRMIEFSITNNLQIHLIYYPPYHSKYNPIEHCWGALERHWNGTILDSTKKAIEWAKTMSWKGINPIVNLLDKIYEGGITLSKKEMKRYEDKIIRLDALPKWDVFIDFNNS